MSTYRKAQEDKSLADEIWAASLTLIGAFAFIVATIAAAAALKGWVLTVLWGWFVVPVFHLPQLSLPAAIGLSAIVGYLTRENVDAVAPVRTRKQKLGRAAFVWSGPFAALGFGWIVHQFM